MLQKITSVLQRSTGKVLVSSMKIEAMSRGCRPKDKGVDVILVV